MKLTLKEYSDLINNILHEKCEKLNMSKPLFAAVHHTLPEDFFNYYYSQGISIGEAIEDIENG